MTWASYHWPPTRLLTYCVWSKLRTSHCSQVMNSWGDCVLTELGYFLFGPFIQEVKSWLKASAQRPGLWKTRALKGLDQRQRFSRAILVRSLGLRFESPKKKHPSWISISTGLAPWHCREIFKTALYQNFLPPKRKRGAAHSYFKFWITVKGCSIKPRAIHYLHRPLWRGCGYCR